jgi:hypothetical protein
VRYSYTGQKSEERSGERSEIRGGGGGGRRLREEKREKENERKRR